MNEKELERLDEILDGYRLGGIGNGSDLREKLVEFIDGIAVEIISYAHPVINEYKEKEDE